ncbi:hypothetical protein EPUS_02217 [Endocarpon pusillum Z07020]|uniref:Uncharacterized protein n=1 Tax=Endocarpon pusillum (strain Z07020 / HMAS-L-300199) TaxID=1263415 RepID=U1GW37_ENDPU|nr:uncharacterized protein EPUS_02217 [Endocarpon pusillum Z07020]ERF76678.1 hypothetical protein EPUS_02217 [Endocarpon pusillum Z07020]
MSNPSSGSTFGSLSASDNSYIGTLPIVRLLEDVDAYAGAVFEMSTGTLNELLSAERFDRDRGELVGPARLDGQEKLLTSFHQTIEDARNDLSNMKSGDFAALSLVWGSGAEVVGQELQEIIKKLAEIKGQVADLRDNIHGNSIARRVESRSETAAELFARHKSLMNIHTDDGAIRYQRDIHPCKGALQLLKGDDGGIIDRCLRKDLTLQELERLDKGGKSGTYHFWKCDSCVFRIKYFVSKSRYACLLTNDDNCTFKDSKVQCTRAFIAMSHVEQRGVRKHSSLKGPPKYTCLICALHRLAARPDHDHTFLNREDYMRHVEDLHIDGNTLPAFVLQKLGIEHGGKLPDGVRRELWIG